MILRFERERRDDPRNPHPACFALFMATGIVAVAAHLHGVPRVPAESFRFNVLLSVALATATFVRFPRYRDAFAADVHRHGRGVGLLAIVAATGVFGNRHGRHDFPGISTFLAFPFTRTVAISSVPRSYATGRHQTVRPRRVPPPAAPDGPREPMRIRDTAAPRRQ